MEFKVNRESFCAPQTTLDSSFEQSVEKDFVLPDYYPDIFRILKCTVTPSVLSSSINGEKLNIELNVIIKVLYLSENDSRVNCLEQKMNFSKAMDLTGECTNPAVTVTPKCDYINCRVVNQRRLDVRGAVTAAVKVVSEKKQAVVTDAFGCGIQLKKQLVTFPSKRITVAKRITVIDELEMSASKPPVGTVIRCGVNIVPSDKKIIAGKLVTKGDAEISMLYSCIDPEGENSLETMKFTIPFSQIIDAEGIDESFEANLDITPGSCEIIPKGEDGKSLECELVILVNCTAYKYETCEAVVDAYSTCYECESQLCSGQISAVPKPVSDSHTVSCTVKYQEDAVGCVYDSCAQCENVTARFDGDKKCFLLSGNIKFSVIGRNSGKNPFFLEGETPLEKEIPIPEGCGEDVSYEPKVSVAACSYYLADENSIELKADLKIGGVINEQCARSVLTELSVCTDKPKEKQVKYALKLCYCRKDEDIWEIAKRYSTSISAIMEENELTEDRLTEQGMLLIPLMK